MPSRDVHLDTETQRKRSTPEEAAACRAALLVAAVLVAYVALSALFYYDGFFPLLGLRVRA